MFPGRARRAAKVFRCLAVANPVPFVCRRQHYARARDASECRSHQGHPNQSVTRPPFVRPGAQGPGASPPASQWPTSAQTGRRVFGALITPTNTGRRPGTTPHHSYQYRPNWRDYTSSLLPIPARFNHPILITPTNTGINPAELPHHSYQYRLDGNLVTSSLLPIPAGFCWFCLITPTNTGWLDALVPHHSYQYRLIHR